MADLGSAVVSRGIQELMADKKLLIADGHHRYETALAFRNENPRLEDASRVVMTFVNMHSPGLKILATHRLIRGWPDFDAAFSAAAVRFRVERMIEALADRGRIRSRASMRIGVALAGWTLCCSRHDRAGVSMCRPAPGADRRRARHQRGAGAGREAICATYGAWIRRWRRCAAGRRRSPSC